MSYVVDLNLLLLIFAGLAALALLSVAGIAALALRRPGACNDTGARIHVGDGASASIANGAGATAGAARTPYTEVAHLENLQAHLARAHHSLETLRDVLAAATEDRFAGDAGARLAELVREAAIFTAGAQVEASDCRYRNDPALRRAIRRNFERQLADWTPPARVPGFILQRNGGARGERLVNAGNRNKTVTLHDDDG